jgi:phenylacetate-coenzyme A ligase PaaK-like adenylate-forming protein
MLQTLRFLLMLNSLKNLRKRSPEDMLALQQARLHRLLHHAVRRSPFYRERFRGIDLDRCTLWDLPILNKTAMMAHFDDLVTDRRVTRQGIEAFIAEPANLGKYYLRHYAVCHTSGSQGQPALVVQSRQDVMREFAVQFARGHPLPKRITTLIRRFWSPVRLAVVTQQPGFYPSGSAFTYLTNARFPFLRLLRLSVFDPVGQTVERLNDFRPQFLSGYTSSLEVLAHEEADGRLRLRETGRLDHITNLSEAMPPTSRDFIEETFGVHVGDSYSMAECMALTNGCNIQAGCHLNVDLACLEVVDEEGRPCPPERQEARCS